MIKRTITGAFIVATLVGFFFLRGVDYRLFNILIFGLSVLGAMEMLNALKDKLTVATKVITLLFSCAVIPLATFFGLTGVAIPSGVFLLVILSLLVFNYNNITVEGVALAILSYCYPSLLLVTMVFANALTGYGLIALLLMFVISPCADTFAYLVGSLIKGKKLCPSISPHKTISGASGGLLGGIIGSVSLFFIVRACGSLPEITFMNEIALFVLIGLVCSLFTEFGDLVESVIKRKIGVKDMGKILPGHGGILDRIDGIIFSSALVYAVFAIIAALG